MREPLSVFTNIAYLIGGLVLMRNGGPVGIACGLGFLFLAITSAWYHWALTTRAQLADERGMYVCLALLIAAQLHAFDPMAGVIAIAPALLLGITLAGAAERIDSYKVIPTLSIGVIVIHGLAVSWDSALWITGALAGAVVIREGHDRSKRLKPYRDVIHGVWHLATALYLFLLAGVAIL